MVASFRSHHRVVEVLLQHGAGIEYVDISLAGHTLHRESATQDQLYRLKAIRRSLLRVDAVRAASWLWYRDVPLIAGVVGNAIGKEFNKASNPLGVLILRRGTRVRMPFLLARIIRHSTKP